jgi:hypothetical protein
MIKIRFFEPQGICLKTLLAWKWRTGGTDQEMITYGFLTYI